MCVMSMLRDTEEERYHRDIQRMEKEYLIACKIQCNDIIIKILASFEKTDDVHSSRDTVDKTIAIHDLFLLKVRNGGSKNNQEDYDLANNNVLLSATCYLIASKFHDGSCPSLKDMERILARRSCTADAIRKAEFTILSVIDWEIFC